MTFEQFQATRPGQQTPAQLMRLWRQLANLGTSDAGSLLRLSARTIENIEQGRTRADDELTRIALHALIDDELQRLGGE